MAVEHSHVNGLLNRTDTVKVWAHNGITVHSGEGGVMLSTDRLEDADCRTLDDLLDMTCSILAQIGIIL